MNRVHVIVHGRVQGVGFRLFAVQEATRRGLAGWVRNKGEEEVEIVAEGSKEQLQDFLSVLRQGPALACVQSWEVQWQPATGEFRAFSARASAW
jgi:acylphosphatase